MKPENPPHPGNAAEEVSALIETLHATGQRLEELTAGEVDTVTDRRGRTILLRRAQDHMRHNEAAKQAAILNALPAHIALLDAQGLIISVNEAWSQFAGANALQGPGYGVGLNYLEICDHAKGDDAALAHQVAAGIRSVLASAAKVFSFEYPCHSPTEQRWFLMTVTALTDEAVHGAVVMHLNITERKLLELTQAKNRAQLRTLVQTIPDMIWLKDAQGIYLSCNPMFERFFGAREADIIGKTDYDFVDKELADFFRAHDRKAMAAGKPSSNEEWLTFPDDGHRGLFETIKTPMLDVEGKLIGVLGIARDITERKVAADRIVRLNRVYAVLSGINTLIVRTRDRQELLDQACRITVEQGKFRLAWIGLLDANGLDVTPVARAGVDAGYLDNIRLTAKDDAPDRCEMLARTLREKTAVVCNDIDTDPQMARWREEALRRGYRSVVAFPLQFADKVLAVLALYASEKDFFDTQEMKLLTELAGDIGFAIDHIEKQERLNYLAYYDVLTGLANRTLFFDRLRQYKLSAVNGGHKLALFLFDLERFRNINDSLGRPAGDELLRQVAQWLTRIAGDANLVARVGTDLFAVVMPEVRQDGNVARLLEKTMEALQEYPFRLNDAVFRIAAKVGVALFPDDGANAEILFKNAEAALKKAKAGGERYLFYTQKMTEAMAGKLTLENQLRQAIDKGEFVLHYQPKVNMASGKMTSAEALIRWNDPRSGLVTPGRFIPILEETGLIYEVGRWALKKALGDYLRWRNAGLPVVRIAVNVSPLQLRHRGFVNEVRQVIGIDTSAAAGMELEITESVIMEDVKGNIASLQAIRDLGVTIAIDDFGTGFSSLAYLAKLPVDTLKIDRSFVTDMTAGPQGLALVSTIISLAHALNLKVVAEGVETEEQSHLLRLLGCDEMQGFLFSKPVPGEIFEVKFLVPASDT